MRIYKNKVFFWGSEFSQWFVCEFELEGEKFSSAEQWMMYSKAKLFNDNEIAKKILNTNNPKKQKELGRQVKNFNSTIWDKHKFDIVVKGNIAKFGQNVDLLDILIDEKYDDKIFVEGSPYDTVWGVGLHWKEAPIQDEKNWKGDNLLGKALNQVRSHLLGGH